jgi:O-antigen/teichoic acid export membrane protein
MRLIRTAHHFTLLFAGEGAAQVLGFAAVTYLARVLEPAGFGLWLYAITIVSYAATLVEAGTDTWGIREIGAAPERFPAAVTTVLWLRAALALGAAVLVGVYALAVEPAGDRSLAILLGIPSIVAIALQTHWALRAVGVIGPVAMAGPLQRATFLAAVVALIHDPTGAPWVVFWQGVSELVVSLYLLAVTLRATEGKLPRPARKTISAVARSTWPVGAARALRGIMYALNITVLVRFWPNAVVGHYGVATRLLMALLVVSTLFGTAVAPGLARAAAEGGAAAGRTVEASLRGAAAAFFPLALGGVVVAPRLVTTLFGDRYSPAVPAVRMLLVVLVLTAFVDILRRTLHFLHRQHADLRNMVVCALLSVALSVALVPALGTRGAAASLVAAEVALLALSTRTAFRAGLALPRPRAFLNPAVAAGAMIAALWPVRHMSLAFTVPLAGLVYVAVLRALRDTTLAGLRVLDAPETAVVREVDAAVARESPTDHLP